MSSTRRIGYVTIANGASLSDAYEIGDHETLTGIIVPAFTSAVITLAGGIPLTTEPAYLWAGPNGTTEYRDGLTYVPVQVATGAATTEWTTTATTGGVYIAIDGRALNGVGFVRVRSGTNAAAVVQAAERIIGLVTTNIA